MERLRAIILDKLREKGMTQTKLVELIDMSDNGFKAMFDKETLRLDKLKQIIKILEIEKEKIIKWSLDYFGYHDSENLISSDTNILKEPGDQNRSRDNELIDYLKNALEQYSAERKQWLNIAEMAFTIISNNQPKKTKE